MLLAFFPTATGIWIIAAIIGTGVTVAGFLLRSAPKGEEAIQLAQSATDSWRARAEALDADLREEREARSSALEAIDSQREEITKLREKTAELSARPDTQQMLHVFEEHHADNQKAMKALLDNQSAGLDELRKVGEGLTRLLERDQTGRASDRRRSPDQ